MSRVLVVLITALVSSPAMAASPVTSETATSGAVRATVSYVLLRKPKWSIYYVRLNVARSGKQVYDERVPSLSRPGAWNQPIGVWRKSGQRTARTISLRDLDGDGDPEILLDFWFGGAHCCYWTRIHRWDERNGTYSHSAHFWGNVGYHLEDINHAGRLELVTADDRFAGAFTDFAGSGFPIQVWDYRSGRLVNKTRSYPTRIARDTAQQWKSYVQGRRHSSEVRGLLAAWAADEALLGHGRAALTWLKRHSFVLSGLYDEQHSGSAQSYLKRLHALLRRTGYFS